MLIERAPAKINLALHVRRRRDDGYHDIETLFAFAQGGDVLHAEAADDLSLTIGGPFGAGLSTGEDNLVLCGARALQAAYGVGAGAALHLDKRLPIASGIGGGSSDAAAAIMVLTRLWGLDEKPAITTNLAANLGADVPACLLGKTCRGDGRGDDLCAVEAGALAGMPLLLVNPGVACPTGAVFAAWDRQDRGALGDGDPLSVAMAGRNDLERPAVALVPEIALVLARLATTKPILARMSGSGATCFALYDSAAARDTAAAGFADMWTMATRVAP